MEKLPKEAFGDLLSISQRRNTLLHAQLLQLDNSPDLLHEDFVTA